MAMIDQHDQAEDEALEQKQQDAGDAFPQLVERANEFVALSEEVDRMEEVLKDLKARREHLRKSAIPDLMRKAGLVNSKNKGSFTIPGRKIYLETRVQASVNETNKPSFFAWLRQQKEDYMIKETVHSQTLTSWVKGRREEGLDIPSTVSVLEETVAKSMKA